MLQTIKSESPVLEKASPNVFEPENVHNIEEEVHNTIGPIN